MVIEAPQCSKKWLAACSYIKKNITEREKLWKKTGVSHLLERLTKSQDIIFSLPQQSINCRKLLGFTVMGILIFKL
jgi:hypothetical protein